MDKIQERMKTEIALTYPEEVKANHRRCLICGYYVPKNARCRHNLMSTTTEGTPCPYFTTSAIVSMTS